MHVVFRLPDDPLRLFEGPDDESGTPVGDAIIARALEAGATLEVPPADHFYGERSGCVRDPFGHRWNIGHHIEDVSAGEMQRRYTEMLQPK
jgi:catechol 2,3-dioxygenase-like lactoylglutathione lyase family enzyme